MLVLINHLVTEAFYSRSGLSLLLGVLNEKHGQEGVNTSVLVDFLTSIGIRAEDMNKLRTVVFSHNTPATLLEACRRTHNFGIREHVNS
jgi:hypothetical protein